MASNDVDIEEFSSSADAESEPKAGPVCQPCSEDGENLEAKGYCQDCCLFLCDGCYKYHKKLPNHVLMDQDNMPKDMESIIMKDICAEKCTEHDGKIIEYYCSSHDYLGCNVCVTLEHRNCDGVVFIPKVSKNLPDSQEYKDLMKRVQHISERSQTLEKNAVDTLDESETMYSKVLQDLSRFRQDVTDALDQLENTVKEQANKLRTADTEKLKSISENIKTTMKKLQMIASDLANLQERKQYCKLFVKMKKVKSRLEKIGDSLGQEDGMNVTWYKFQPNRSMQECLSKPYSLGELKQQKLKGTHVSDISVETEKRMYACDISGSVILPDNKLIVADSYYDKLKLLDIKQNKMISEIKLPSWPWSVAQIKGEHIVITQPNVKKILFVSLGSGLSVERETQMSNKCWGIACMKDKLVVTYSDPGKVEIIDMQGNVLQSFDKDAQGKQLFAMPYHVAVSNDSKTIYVSDTDNNTVTSLGMDGKVKAVYKDSELKKPRQIVVDQMGVVYVCGEDSCNIHMLTPRLIKIKVLLEKSDGFTKGPRSVSFCEDTNRLYVGMYDCNEVKVYQLS